MRLAPTGRRRRPPFTVYRDAVSLDTHRPWSSTVDAVTDESIYAHFRRSFWGLWRDPEKPLRVKFAVTVFAAIAGVLGSLGF